MKGLLVKLIIVLLFASFNAHALEKVTVIGSDGSSYSSYSAAKKKKPQSKKEKNKKKKPNKKKPNKKKPNKKKPGSKKPKPNKPSKVTYQTFATRVTGASLQIASNMRSYKSYEQAISKGYIFEIVEASAARWVFRVFFQGSFVVDIGTGDNGTSNGLPSDLDNFFAELVWNAENCNQQSSAGSKFAILLPDLNDVNRSQFVESNVADFYNTVKILTGRGYFFHYQNLYGSYRLTATDAGGNLVIAEANPTLGVFYLADSSLMLIDDVLDPALTTYTPSSLENRFISALASAGASFNVDGFDAAGLPLVINANMPGGATESFFPKAKLRFVHGGRSSLVDNSFQHLIYLDQLRLETQQAVMFAAFRNFYTTFSGNESTYNIEFRDPKGIESFSMAKSANSLTVTASPLRFGNAYGQSLTLKQDNPYMFLLAGLLNDMSKEYGTFTLSGGGDLHIPYRGYVAMSHNGGSKIFHAAGATVYEDQTIRLPGVKSVVIKKDDSAHASILDAVAKQLIVVVHNETESTIELLITAGSGANINNVTVYKNGGSPYIRVISPSAPLYADLFNSITRYLTSIQFQTSMDAIANVSPTQTSSIQTLY